MPEPIRLEVVPSAEPLDVRAWARQYAAFVVRVLLKPAAPTERQPEDAA